jgi:hypothetical protein
MAGVPKTRGDAKIEFKAYSHTQMAIDCLFYMPPRLGFIDR